MQEKGQLYHISYLSISRMSKSVPQRRDFLFIKSEYKLVRINLPEILFLSGMRDYTQVYLKGRAAPVCT